MTQLPNMDNLEKTEIKVNSEDSMFQRVVSKTYLNEWYVNNVFRSVSRELKELKTLEEVIEITESICMDIYKQELTWDAYDFIQGVLNKLKSDNGSV